MFHENSNHGKITEIWDSNKMEVVVRHNQRRPSVQPKSFQGKRYMVDKKQRSTISNLLVALLLKMYRTISQYVNVSIQSKKEIDGRVSAI